MNLYKAYTVHVVRMLPTSLQACVSKHQAIIGIQIHYTPFSMREFYVGQLIESIIRSTAVSFNQSIFYQRPTVLCIVSQRLGTTIL